MIAHHSKEEKQLGSNNWQMEMISSILKPLDYLFSEFGKEDWMIVGKAFWWRCIG